MNALVLANFPIAALIFAAIVGMPLWLTFKRPDLAPRYTGARAYSGATAVPVRAAAVPAGAALARRASAPRVSPARQHMAPRPARPAARHPHGHVAA